MSAEGQLWNLQLNLLVLQQPISIRRSIPPNFTGTIFTKPRKLAIFYVALPKPKKTEQSSMEQTQKRAQSSAMRRKFLKSYSLIDSFEVVCDRGVYRLANPSDPYEAITDRVIKLRNPWGESAYKADWYAQYQIGTSNLKNGTRNYKIQWAQMSTQMGCSLWSSTIL